MARQPEWQCLPPGYTVGSLMLALLYIVALFRLLFWRLRAARGAAQAAAVDELQREVSSPIAATMLHITELTLTQFAADRGYSGVIYD